ncbi:zinc finger protein 62 homolog [Cloeon dipterum]|uniref:zinc finger protein 62 homolog n=1 Tax=Cloeon dipterum TaxID=197152 RepID=UPI00321F9B30
MNCFRPTSKRRFKYLIHSSRDQVNDQVKQAHENNTTKCHFCGENFRSKRSVTSHIIQTHTKAVNGYKAQPTVARARPDPDAKQLKPYRAIPASCEICKQVFPSKTGMRKHMSEKHNLRAEICKCRLCDKSYIGRCGLNHHMRTKHSNEKPYMCSFCGKSFQTGNQLSLHEANHAEKTIECDVCDKKFPSKMALRSHKQSVHGPFKYIQCEICGKTYKTIDIASHKRAVHIDDSKKYVHECVICGKKYAGVGGLKFHLLRHENALRFECDICSKRYNTKNSIQSHILIHLDDRKHKCNLCDKAFVMNHMLKSHMLTHTQEKRFACEVCGQRFRWKHDRDKHQNRKHSIPIPKSNRQLN